MLKGDMSLVGPRPMMPDQRALYPGEAYFTLRPGITGFWQISDCNASIFAQRAEFDAATRCDLKATIPLLVLFGLVYPHASNAQSVTDEAAALPPGAAVEAGTATWASRLRACEEDRTAEGCPDILIRAFVCGQAPEMDGCAAVAELEEPQPDVTPPEAEGEVYVEPRAEGAIEAGLEEDIPARSELKMYDEPEED